MALTRELGASLEVVSRDLSTSPTLPPACYHAPEVYEVERVHILRESWLGVGRADRWEKPGDYAALLLGEVPVIVLRDSERRLRAFANTCRHRGTQLLAGAGHVERIACPFHGWTYALDGRLRGATRMGHAAGFRLEDFGLVAFRAAERAGFAFVCMDERTPDIDAWLGGEFAALHAPWALERLVTTRRRELEVECNWKLFLEVFNEGYHLEFVHPRTFAGIYQDAEPPDIRSGPLHSQFNPTLGTGGLKSTEQANVLPSMPGLEGRNREGTRYTWVFPSLTFAAGSEALWAYDAQPLGAQRCRITQWVGFPPETVAAPGFEEKAERYYARMDEALDEDLAALGRQQAGMRSPFARQGRWGNVEIGASGFAGWYAERLRASLGS